MGNIDGINADVVTEIVFTETSKHMHVPLEDMMSNRRFAWIAHARYIAYYVCEMILSKRGFKLVEIASSIKKMRPDSKMNHTNIVHGLAYVTRRMSNGDHRSSDDINNIHNIVKERIKDVY